MDLLMTSSDIAVRYVGQPIGSVVARSRAIAEDVAERVDVDIDPLSAVTRIDAALATGTPLLYPEIGTNVAGEIHFGDSVANLEQAIATASHVMDCKFGCSESATALWSRVVCWPSGFPAW
jgi:aerobic carbon-monoxide dehydrogenase large subunit